MKNKENRLKFLLRVFTKSFNIEETNRDTSIFTSIV